MIIDWHGHVTPDDAAAAPHWRGRCPSTLARFLAAHHAAGIGLSVVSNAAHSYRDKSEDDLLRMVGRWHDYAAGRQRDHAELVCFASTIPCGGESFLRELERAV